MNLETEKVLVIDLGGRHAQVLAQQVRNLNVYSETVNWKNAVQRLKTEKPVGIILTGLDSCEATFKAKTSFPIAEIFQLGIPILCCGRHSVMECLGGTITQSEKNEFLQVETQFKTDNDLFSGLPEVSKTWAVNADCLKILPNGFVEIASTTRAKNFAVMNTDKKIYGLQFNIVNKKTECGNKILENFLFKICGAKGTWKIKTFLASQIDNLQKQIGDGKVLLALSGGVDSSVLAALLEKAVGKNLNCIFVDTGLMRKNEGDEVEKTFKNTSMNFIRVNAAQRYMKKLEGVYDPEKKRKIIGEEFIRIFEEEALKIGTVDFLAQGTIYPDVAESGETGSALIKSHHNVGGLPKNIKFKSLVEPLRFLFKDEVRKLGTELGLPEKMVKRQPFPGPGLAIRIMGEVTQNKIKLLQEADFIFRTELEKAKLEASQYFAVLTNNRTVGVTGNSRTYDYTLALRAVRTTDFMAATIVHIPFELLEKISRRIIDEVKGINRVVYDITSKPPATIEWE